VNFGFSITISPPKRRADLIFIDEVKKIRLKDFYGPSSLG